MTYDEALENLNNVLGDHVARLNNFKLDKIAAIKSIEALKEGHKDAINKLSIGDISFDYDGYCITAHYTPSKERALQNTVSASCYFPNLENLEATKRTFHGLLAVLFGDIAAGRHNRPFTELATVLGYLRLIETTITEEYRQGILAAKESCDAAVEEKKKLERGQEDWAAEVKVAMSALAEAWVMKRDFAPGDKVSVFDQRSGIPHTKTVKRFVKTSEKTTVYIENGGYFRINDGHLYYLETWFLYNPSYKEILHNLMNA